MNRIKVPSQMRLLNVADDSLAIQVGRESFAAGGREDVESQLKLAFTHHLAGGRKLALAAMRVAKEVALAESRTVSRMVATAFCLIGEWAHAIPIYRTLIRLAPGDSRSYNGLGVALYQVGRVKQAAEALREALILAPRYAGVQYLHGLIAARHGRATEAAEAFRAALSGRPWEGRDDLTLREVFASLSRAHELSVAKSVAGEVATSGHTPPHKRPAHRARMVRLYSLVGDLPAACQEFQRLRRLAPELAEPLDEELSLTALAAVDVLAGAEAAVDRPSAYQLKITLRDVRPPIWRRVVVPGHISLSCLHQVIQVAMGWEERHLHRFVIGGVAYGIADRRNPAYVDDVREERHARLNTLVRRAKAKFHYDYDFGDGWRHDVLVERIVPDQEATQPWCLDGRRACPPEDCGGPWGYACLLEALEDPEHPEHETWVGWVGDYFEPEAFFLSYVNHRLGEIKLTSPKRGRGSRPPDPPPT